MGLLRSLRRSVHRVNKSRRRLVGGKRRRSRQVGGSGCGGGVAGHEAFGHDAKPVATGGAKRRRRRTRKH